MSDYVRNNPRNEIILLNHANWGYCTSQWKSKVATAAILDLEVHVVFSNKTVYIVPMNICAKENMSTK